MARLVAVCRDGEEEFPFERRQIPLYIDDTLTVSSEGSNILYKMQVIVDMTVCAFLFASLSEELHYFEGVRGTFDWFISLELCK